MLHLNPNERWTVYLVRYEQDFAVVRKIWIYFKNCCQSYNLRLAQASFSEITYIDVTYSRLVYK